MAEKSGVEKSPGLKCPETHLVVALFVTLLFAIVGGILVGFILKAIGSLQGKSTLRYFKLCILYVFS